LEYIVEQCDKKGILRISSHRLLRHLYANSFLNSSKAVKILFTFFSEKHPSDLDENWQRLDHIVKHNETFKRIFIGKIECSVFRPTCKQFHLEKYPSVVWMQKGRIVDNYIGDNMLKSLKSFLDNKFQEHVIEHDARTTEIPYTVSVLSTENASGNESTHHDVKIEKETELNDAKSIIDSILKPVGKIINQFVYPEKKDVDEKKPADIEPLPKLPIDEPKIKDDDTGKVRVTEKPVQIPKSNETKAADVKIAGTEIHSKEKIRIVVPIPSDKKQQDNKDTPKEKVEEKPWESIKDPNATKIIHDHHDHHSHHHHKTEPAAKPTDNKNVAEEKVIEPTKIDLLPPINNTQAKANDDVKKSQDDGLKIKEVVVEKPEDEIPENKSAATDVVPSKASEPNTKDDDDDENEKTEPETKPPSENKDDSKRGESDEKPAAKVNEAEAEEVKEGSEESKKVLEDEYEKIRDMKEAEEMVKEMIKKKMNGKSTEDEEKEQSEEEKQDSKTEGDDEKSETAAEEKSDVKSPEVSKEKDDNGEEIQTTLADENEDDSNEHNQDGNDGHEEADDDYEVKEDTKNESPQEKAPNDAKSDKEEGKTEKLVEKEYEDQKDMKDEDDQGEIINLSELFKSHEVPVDSKPAKTIKKQLSAEQPESRPKVTH
jgi:hypothetical protein